MSSQKPDEGSLSDSSDDMGSVLKGCAGSRSQAFDEDNYHYSKQTSDEENSSKKLRAENKRLAQERDYLEEQLRESEEDKNRLRQMNRKLESELKALRDTHFYTEEQLRKITRKAKETESEVEELTKKNLDLLQETSLGLGCGQEDQDTVKRLESQLEAERKRANETERRNDLLEEKAAELNRQLRSLQDESSRKSLMRGQQQHQELDQLKQLKEQVSQLRYESNSREQKLQQEAEQLQTKCSNLQEVLQRKDEELERLKRENQNIRSSSAKMQQDHNTQVRNMQSQIEALTRGLTGGRGWGAFNRPHGPIPNSTGPIITEVE